MLKRHWILAVGFAAGMAATIIAAWFGFTILKQAVIGCVATAVAMETCRFMRDRLTPEVTSRGVTDASADAFGRGECPDCGSTEFIHGAEGGICINVECAECHSKWNVAFAMGQCLFAERLDDPK